MLFTFVTKISYLLSMNKITKSFHLKRVWLKFFFLNFQKIMFLDIKKCYWNKDSIVDSTHYRFSKDVQNLVKNVWTSDIWKVYFALVLEKLWISYTEDFAILTLKKWSQSVFTRNVSYLTKKVFFFLMHEFFVTHFLF